MKLLLIDGNSVLFRAFYATSFNSIMQTSFGAYTNAVYAFANMLNKALKLIEPDYCCVAFDKGKATFRHKMTSDYKAGRKETPVELVEQFKLVRDMLDAYNIKYLEYDEIEADDIIGILANKVDVDDICIFSSDHDLFQLINDNRHTKIYCMKKGMSDISVLDEKALYAEYSLKPYQIIDFKGLAGDKSDNIKGVEGVGEKTAIKLLNDYDTCEGIYEHIDEIKGKLKDKLINDKQSCFISKKLATILTDYKLDVDLQDLKLNIDVEGKNNFFDKYEMRTLIDKSYVPVSTNNVEGKKVNKISSALFNNPFIYFVSDDFSYYQRSLYGIIFVNDKGIEYIELEDFKKDEEALTFLKSDKPKVVYGLKDVKHQLDYHGLEIGDNTDDLFLMCFLINNNYNELPKIMHGFGYNLKLHLKDVFGTEKKPIEFNETSVLAYGYEVSNNLYHIYPKAIEKLKEYKLLDYYKNIELKLSYVLYSMEKEGILVDVSQLDEIGSRTKEKIKELEKDIYILAGEEFNINSPVQLKNIIYNKLELPNLKKDSTDAEVLNKLIDYHPIISKILEYRKYSKLNSTYAEGLKRYIGPDNKIHTIFSQTSTATGRLSSSEPNMQNISIRDEELREIRKAFKPSANSVILSSDYSQIELRVIAALAKEDKMIDAFNDGIDIHSLTAMNVFNVSKEEVTPLLRRHAKAVNFGVVYGISEFGLANQTSLSYKEASKYIEDYFKNYPHIKEYMDNEVKFCEKNGYVLTMLNRRRYIDEIKASKWALREFGKRAAMNSPIQGSAADLIKIAMINVFEEIKKNNLKSKLILQVHDELIFDVPSDEIEIMSKLVKDTMINAYKLAVNLDVSLNYGTNWYEAK